MNPIFTFLAMSMHIIIMWYVVVETLKVFTLSAYIALKWQCGMLLRQSESLGPTFLRRLCEHSYLNNFFFPLLEEMEIDTEFHYFQQDGATVHTSDIPMPTLRNDLETYDMGIFKT